MQADSLHNRFVSMLSRQQPSVYGLSLTAARPCCSLQFPAASTRELSSSGARKPRDCVRSGQPNPGSGPQGSENSRWDSLRPRNDRVKTRCTLRANAPQSTEGTSARQSPPSETEERDHVGKCAGIPGYSAGSGAPCSEADCVADRVRFELTESVNPRRISSAVP